MKIDEIERQTAGQYSAMQSFPSQTSALEQMFSGQNQRAAIELQIESAKLLAYQEKKLEKLNDVVYALYERIEQRHVASKEREKVENERYKKHTRLTEVAAWSGVIAVILSAVGIWAQIALK